MVVWPCGARLRQGIDASRMRSVMYNNSSAVVESPVARSSDQLRLLIEVSEAIATQHDLTTLFRDLAKRLPSIVPFELIALFLHDPDKQIMRVHML
ncbi:MAG TPA: hypothetical protein VH458_00520, partial [Vicinamibacterales bacterium]